MATPVNVKAFEKITISDEIEWPDANLGAFRGIQCIVWRMINDQADGDADPLGGGGADWEISDDIRTEAPLLATAVTESSGIFSFGSTGYWKIESSVRFTLTSGEGNETVATLNIVATDDNSNYTVIAAGYCSFTDYTAATVQGAHVAAVIKVSNVGNDKIKLTVGTTNANTYADSSTNLNTTYVMFTKLADL